MPFAQKDWVFAVQSGDLVYGVNSDMGRKKFMKTWSKKGAITVDSIKVLKEDGGEENARSKSLLACIANHNKFYTAGGGESSNENIRRKCKAGIEWSVGRKKQVHFVLDDLDLAAVVGKNWTGKNPDQDATEGVVKNRSVTGSELRWIYRNRKRKDVQEHIQFWIDCGPCSPPWEAAVEVFLSRGRFGEKVTFQPGIWLNYKPDKEALGDGS